MKAETYALAVYALQGERDKLRKVLLLYSSKDMLPSYQAELASFDAAIADLEAEQAAAQPVAIPDDVREAIESLRALVVAYVAMQVGKPTSADEKYMNDARIVRAWLDEQQRRPEQDSITGDDNRSEQ